MEIGGKRAALKEVVAIKGEKRYATSVLLMLICKVEIKRKTTERRKAEILRIDIVLSCLKNVTVMNLNRYFEIFKDKNLLEI